MTHLSEERNIPATPEAVWAIISDTKQWPRFFATPREILHLRSVEYLDGATQDGPDVKRRLHFLGVPSWDEQATRWRVNDNITWLGTRNPGQKYWTQQIELIAGKGFTTLRWDIFYNLSAPGVPKKAYKAALEDILLSSLQRVERLATETKKG
ncbi:MAG: SRPBCC family protein [Candidatus Thermoplasmatota archaeon]